jgi:hypothetical protein
MQRNHVVSQPLLPNVPAYIASLAAIVICLVLLISVSAMQGYGNSDFLMKYLSSESQDYGQDGDDPCPVINTLTLPGSSATQLLSRYVPQRQSWLPYFTPVASSHLNRGPPL